MNKKLLAILGFFVCLQGIEAVTVYSTHSLIRDLARRVVHPYIKPTTEDKMVYGFVSTALAGVSGIICFDSFKDMRITGIISAVIGLGAYKFFKAVHVQPSHYFLAHLEKCDITFLDTLYSLSSHARNYSFEDLVNAESFYNFTRRDAKYPALSFEQYVLEQRKTLDALQKFVTTYNHFYDYNSREILLEIARFIDIVQPVISQLLHDLINSYEYKQDVMQKKEDEMREREQQIREREARLREREIRLKKEELDVRERELLEKETEKSALLTIIVNNNEKCSF